jgi:hypothetical protein
MFKIKILAKTNKKLLIVERNWCVFFNILKFRGVLMTKGARFQVQWYFCKDAFAGLNPFSLKGSWGNAK